MDSESNWSWGSSLTLLAVVITLTVAGGYLVAAYHLYDQISTVAAGLWGAATAVLAVLGVRRKRDLTLAELFALRPVRLVAGVYAAFVLLSLPVLAMLELPVHRVTFEAPWLSVEEAVALQLIRSEDDTSSTGRDHAGHWRLYERRGDYTARISPAGYEPQELPFQVYPWQLRRHLIIPAARPVTLEPARLRIRTQLPELSIRIDSVPPGSAPESEGPARQGADFAIELAAGLYVVSGQAQGYVRWEEQLRLAPGEDALLEVNPPRIQEPERRGWIEVRPTPPGLEVLVDGSPRGISPLQLALQPGTYLVELRRRVSADFGIHHQAHLTVIDGDTVLHAPPLAPFRLPLVTVITQDAQGTRYVLASDVSETDTIPLSIGSFGLATARVFPGSYHVRRTVDGDRWESGPPVVVGREDPPAVRF